MPRLHKKIFSELLKLNADYKEVWFSQVKLAQRLKVGLSTLKRALTRFKELGIVSWIFRGVKKTCLYTLSPHFHSKALRDKFVHLIDGFKYLPMTMLLSQNALLFAGAQKQLLVASGPQCTNVESLNTLSLSLPMLSLKAVRSISIRESLGIPSSVRAREADDTNRAKSSESETIFLTETKKEKELGMYSASLSISAASNVTAIKLTAYGRLVVSVWPHKAIEFADIETKKIKSPKNPMALFLSSCKKYCDKHGLRPDYTRLNEFKNENAAWEQLAEYEIPETIETKTKKIEIKQTTPDDYRDPETFDRVGEWQKFLNSGYRAPGNTQTAQFINELIDKSKAMGDTVTEDLPIQAINKIAGGIVVEPTLSLPLKKREALKLVLEHKELLGKSMQAHVITKQMRELTEQGASHHLAEHEPFWEGLYYIVGVIREQEAKHEEQRSGLDSIPQPV